MWNVGCTEGSVTYLYLGKFPNLSDLIVYELRQQKSSLTLIFSTVDVDSNDGLVRGSLPTEIRLLSNLKELDVRNSLTGTIPSELGQMSALITLTLRSTAALTGTIPSELGQSSTIQKLLLDHNALTGTIPSELGLISTLQSLQLNSNALTGTIPSELGQISSLRHVWVQSNALTGTVPTELGRVWFLQV
jgi:Leucine-rich repeat (LRR) protein